MCGEQLQQPFQEQKPLGSSPRVRGTAQYLNVTVKGEGIIPACAGNSLQVSQGVSYSRDHPRVCGEQEKVSDLMHQLPGSSPRVRGTVLSRTWLTKITGIIPACAGNSSYLRCGLTL